MISSLLVTQMKSNKRWIHSNAEFKKMPSNVGNEEDNDDTSNTINSSINADNIETEGTSTVSIVVRTCDTDVSHQKRTEYLDL